MENLYKYILITFCGYPRVVGSSVVMSKTLYEAGCAAYGSMFYEIDIHNKTNAKYLVLMKDGRMLTPMKWSSNLEGYLSLEGMGEPVPF